MPRQQHIKLVRKYAKGLRMTGLFLCCLLCLSASKCDSQTEEIVSEYDLSDPNKVIALPKILREISGITWWDGHEVAGVQDEDGYVFIIDLKKEKVEQKEKFEKDGDYEDITKVGKKLYIVRNDGNLYRVKDFDKKDQDTNAYKTKLTTKNDVEGLCYDKANNRLLLLCKEQSRIDKDRPKEKAIYAWDLETKKLSTAPVFSIKIQDIRAYCQKTLNLIPDGEFKPSAIAIHPITGEFYVISSNMKVLVVLNEKGKVRKVYALSSPLFSQPEGLTFDDKATLYISNEGKGGPGTIMKFKYTAPN